MDKTRLAFVLIVGGAAVLVVLGLIFSTAIRSDEPPEAPPATATPTGPIEVRIWAAQGVAEWVASAAEAFSAGGETLDGRDITVSVVPIDSLVALSRFETGTLDSVPTAWIPDSRWLVELANAALKDSYGRDIFLTDGEYRARPVAISLLTWGIFQSRAEALEQWLATTGHDEISWQALHDAALIREWSQLGGPAEWGYLKLLMPSPRRNVAGLGALISAAGDYYGRPNITTEDLENPEFQQWLDELVSAVQDFSSYFSAEDLALFGTSTGEISQLVESDIIQHMSGAANRQGEALRVYYPRFVSWYDYPFTTWIGTETTATEKNAALIFMRYLLTDDVQAEAVGYGLRPVSDTVKVDEVPDSPFLEWQDQGLVTLVQRPGAMRSPDRDTLQALLDWFDTNIME